MVDLSIGGPSWAGWHFGVWGRAREWRLHSPCGASFTASEVAQARAVALDVDFLQCRVRELADYAHPGALHFGPLDARALIAAAELIVRAARSFSARGGALLIEPAKHERGEQRGGSADQDLLQGSGVHEE